MNTQDKLTLRQYERRRKRVKAQNRALLIVLGIAFTIFALGVLLGWHLGTTHGITQRPADSVQFTEPQRYKPADEVMDYITKKVSVEPTATLQQDAVSPLLRDDIVSDGNVLSYDLQTIMQRYCAQYEVPYALALAIADQETRFDPDAKSSTNDYGLMQINAINFDDLREKGIEPLDYEGNIHGGVLILSQNLNRHNNLELAVMAYNLGNAGAKELWDAGTHHTNYSKQVMDRYQKWVAVLEGK